MASNQNTLAAATVTTAGTRVQLNGGTSKLVRSLRITGDSGNGSGYIYVGDKNVSSSRYIARLAVDDFYTFDAPVVDIARVWIDASSNGLKAQVSYAS